MEETNKTKNIEVKKGSLITDRPLCCAIFKVPDDVEDEIVIEGSDGTFKRDKEIKILREDDGDRIYVYKNSKRILTLSRELYDSARKLMSVWYGKTCEFFLNENVDFPIILVNKPMGIIIAPRVEGEE